MARMDADVIVVGAGPAGSTCARLLGQGKRTVLLLDRARFPRNKPCGGWVNVKVFRGFPELDALRLKAGPRNPLVEDGFHGLVFLDKDLGRQAAYTSRSVVGYTVRRRRFDAALAHLAAGEGKHVRLLQRQEVVAVDVGEKGATVTTRAGRRLEGRVLVGADGVDSEVARLCGMRDGWPAERRICCATSELASDPRTLAKLYGKRRRIYVCIGYRGISGHAWAFPKHNTVSVGVGCRSAAEAALKELHGQWIADLKGAELLPQRVRAGGCACAAVPAGGAIDFEGHVGKRTLLIGDAGGFAASASGEGIYPGMLSARVAAKCIDRALGSRHPQDVLLEFKFAWRKAFAEYIQMPNANLSLLLPLIYDNPELCSRLAGCYLFGKNF